MSMVILFMFNEKSFYVVYSCYCCCWWYLQNGFLSFIVYAMVEFYNRVWLNSLLNGYLKCLWEFNKIFNREIIILITLKIVLGWENLTPLIVVVRIKTHSEFFFEVYFIFKIYLSFFIRTPQSKIYTIYSNRNFISHIFIVIQQTANH